MNCLEIVKEYLKKNGFDGLHNEDTDCTCEVFDLMPAHCEDISMCIPITLDNLPGGEEED